MTLTTRIFTYFCGEQVGVDVYGNRYFRTKSQPRHGREKRWVLYRGMAEPSKVPPEWFRWLHYSTDTLPDKDVMSRHAWQQSPIPNLTGTSQAYAPSGHLRKSGVHAPTVAAVEAWEPSA